MVVGVPTGAEEGTDNAALLENLRSLIAKDIEDVKDLETTCVPPAIQEVVIARRALEDARMRLGVALAYVNGQDPLGQK